MLLIKIIINIIRGKKITYFFFYDIIFWKTLGLQKPLKTLGLRGKNINDNGKIKTIRLRTKSMVCYN